MAGRTANLLLADLATGESGVLGYANWGEAADDNFARLEDALTETSSITLAGVNVTLTDEQERSVNIVLTGTLSANVEVRTNDRKGFWFVHNNTTGAYTVTFKPTSGTGVIIAPGARVVIVCDGTDAKPIAITAPLAQCRLDYDSGNLKLSRQNGLFLWVNGKLCTIPSAGVTLSASGLTPNTTYNIYAEQTSGVITSLVPSLTARATHTDGTQIRSGDATRAYVGKARCLTGPAWSADLVLSWFNQVLKTKRVVASGSIISVGTNVIVGSGEFGVLSHGDRAIRNAYNGSLYTNAANYRGTLVVAIDGSAASYGVAGTTNGAGSAWLTPIAHDFTSVPSEGYHTHGAYAQTNGDTSVFTGYFSVDYWG